jgi:hypothetical protein
LVLFSQDLLNDSQEIFVWGHDYAKWDPFEFTIPEYFDSYFANVDFVWEADKVLINHETMRWNNLNNINEVYPNTQYIEYYINWFDPQYEWMDWRSLTLVFEEFEWQYYLVWIINWSWTI